MHRSGPENILEDVEYKAAMEARKEENQRVSSCSEGRPAEGWHDRGAVENRTVKIFLKNTKK